MTDDPKAEGKILAYQMVLSWIPSSGEFGLDAPIGERNICYQMLALALEKLILLAMQQEINAARKKIVTPGGGLN